MKKLLISSVLVISAIALFIVVSPAKSRLQSYYSGDAISYKNNLYVSSTNSGSLEVFKLENKDLRLIESLRVYNQRFNTYDDFFDSKLIEEDGKLYVYAVSNYTIYKYSVSDNKLALLKESSNTYWEWYNRVDKFGDDLATVSAKGVKILNSNLEVINSYNFTNSDAPYNVSGDNDKYLLSVNESTGFLEVYSKESRSVITRIPFNFKHKKSNHRAYQDAAGYIYIVDDTYAKKFDVSGKLLASFKHLDYQGFDISLSPNTDNIYFSNGVGVVKLDSNLKLHDFAWTSNLGGHSSWAMGLKTVYNNGDKIVVFNNTNILVLDDKLNKISSVSATKEEIVEYPSENLFLNIDKNRATVNAEITISGGGFLAKEQLNVGFINGTSTIAVQADSRGRFTKTISVPNIKTGATDIKVVGEKSKLHYSISFLVQ